MRDRDTDSPRNSSVPHQPALQRNWLATRVVSNEVSPGVKRGTQHQPSPCNPGVSPHRDDPCKCQNAAECQSFRFPLGLPQRDHNWSATTSAACCPALHWARPDGSSDWLATPQTRDFEKRFRSASGTLPFSRTGQRLPAENYWKIFLTPTHDKVYTLGYGGVS